MPLVNGFEVINSVPKERLPFIVFVTAYDQYALKAFEIHAVDYLLKPFTNARFAEAIDRAKRLIGQQKLETEQNKLIRLAQQLTDKSATQMVIGTKDGHGISDHRLIVKDQGKIRFLNFDDIIWLEAYDYYVKVHERDTYHLIRESLKRLVEKLPGSHFVRVHKSSIVNANYIKQIEPVGNGEHIITLMNGTIVKVSRSYREAVKKLVE
jgi:two-component system LytT family response regulator